MYTYRDARKADLPIVCKFPQDKYELFNIYPAGVYPFTVEQLESAVESRYDSTVIISRSEVVGFANFYAAKEGNYCGIGNAIIKPSIRRKGVGTFLIKTMVQIAKEKYKAKAVRISCFSNNVPGLLLYTKLGFKPLFIDRVNDPDNNVVARVNFELSC